MWKAFRARTFVLRKRLALLTPERLRLRRNRRAAVALAQHWLGGLKGVEVGGAAHNDFEVDAINIDRFGEYDTVYKREELRNWGTVRRVDLVAPGDDLPLKDGSVDFVLASHVIEHFPDPIAALTEWMRVSRRYLFLVVPHRDRTFDRDRDVTPVDELLDRHARGFTSAEDAHWSVWTCESFLELCEALGLVVCDHRDPDYEGGNGFIVVVDVAASRAAAGAATDREGFEPSIRF